MKKSTQTPPTMDNWQPTDIKKEENLSRGKKLEEDFPTY
jgi:hypothetical protein